MEHVAGNRILVTRARDDNRPWIERLLSLGAVPVPFPCIEIEPLVLTTDWRTNLDQTHWVAFTSNRSVQLFASLLEGANLASHQIAAVGPTTEAACLDRFGRCDLTSTAGTAAALAAALSRKLTPGAAVLLPGASDPRPELAEGLGKEGARTIPLPLYATRPTRPQGNRVKFTSTELDAALFASPSAVSGCFATATLPFDLPTACIGPTTAQAAGEAGMTQTVTSDSRDLDGLLIALCGHLTSNPLRR